MMPPLTQPVRVDSCSFNQQQLSKQWQVVTSGQVSGQLSHQQKQGFNLQSQHNQCGSFSWQQPLQSVQVLQPQPHELQELQPLSVLAAQPQLGASLAAQLAAVDGASAGAAAGAGAAGAAG
jgi:hypothetical protein